jgi:hypothetical protein
MYEAVPQQWYDSNNIAQYITMLYPIPYTLYPIPYTPS